MYINQLLHILNSFVKVLGGEGCSIHDNRASNLVLYLLVLYTDEFRTFKPFPIFMAIY